MTTRSPPPRLLAPERVPWYLILTATVILLVLVVASAGQYASVTQAHANSDLETTYSVIVQGTDSRGVLLENGSVRLSVRLVATNPSPVVLDFQSIIVKAWMANASTASGLYLAFFPSFDVSTLPSPPAPVAARGSGTLDLNFTLNKAVDPARFEVVREIQSAVANETGTALGIRWYLYTLITLRVEGILDPVASAGTYELNLNRVILTWGQDLGT